MPNFLKLDPGLAFWTLVNFGLFVFIIAKFAWKPMKAGLAAREQSIKDSITAAENANAEAQNILREAKEKISGAQAEMMQIVRDGKSQAEELIRKATDEADAVKHQKLVEAQREIEREKNEAIAQLRNEMSTLVVEATEKLLGRTLKDDDHKRIVNDFVQEISKN